MATKTQGASKAPKPAHPKGALRTKSKPKKKAARPAARTVPAISPGDTDVAPLTQAEKDRIEDEAAKAVLGRPSVYRASYGLALIEHCKKGLTVTSFAPLVGVARRTLYLWADEHPEFMHAMQIALGEQQLAIERDLPMQIQSHQISWRLRTLANVAPTQWREKTALVGGDEGDRPVQIQDMTHADAATRFMAIKEKALA